MANLWNNPGVPHKGWLIAGQAQDGGGPIHRCEMCNKPDIRYLHPVYHPEYGSLTVGSECADKMTDDAKIRFERKQLEQSKNKLHYYCDQGWDEVVNNNWMRTYHGYTVSITYTNGHYRYAIFADKRPWHFKTMDEAKRASFDYITKRITTQR